MPSHLRWPAAAVQREWTTIMRYRTGSAGYAIKRHQTRIETDLRSGKSKNSIRRALIACGAIPEVSAAHFNNVVHDFDMAGTVAAPSTSISEAGASAVMSSVTTDNKSGPNTATTAMSQINRMPAADRGLVQANSERISSPFIDPRFPPSPSGEAE